MLDEQAVEDDLTAVVGEIEDAPGALDVPAQLLDQAVHGLLEGLVDRGTEVVLGHLPADAELDDVAGDGQLDREAERVVRCIDALAELRQQMH